LAHLQLVKALASLDQESLLILGSGFSFNNMQTFFRQGAGIPDAKNLAFETWLKEALSNPDLSEAEPVGTPAELGTRPKRKILSPSRGAPVAAACLLWCSSKSLFKSRKRYGTR